jgi:hypothetical protein
MIGLYLPNPVIVIKTIRVKWRIKMVKTIRNVILTFVTLLSLNSYSADLKFNADKDLLLLNFDLKTDVDDVHTIAALDLILQSNEFKNINYYAVSGTYGIQAGLYVPADTLFNIVFKNNWTDAHMHKQNSINNTVKHISKTLSTNGKVWIAEAGQSDFTQELLIALDEFGIPFSKDNIMVVQHSTWNEKETSVDALNFVKAKTTYIKVEDGNKENNGSPGFNNETYPVKNLENEKFISSEAWTEANKISSQYNGVNGRYNNKAISNGGADFSDLVEITSILNIKDTSNVKDFFTKFNKLKK